MVSTVREHNKASSLDATLSDNLLQLFEEEDIDFIVTDCTDIINESTDGLVPIKEIVGGLQTFSHSGSDAHSPLNINDVIANTLTIARGQLKHKCELIENLQQVPEVKGDTGRLSQVFINLLINAGHATSHEGGRIEISSSFSDGFVVVTVTDNGSGISEENIDKLFEPFFTTKDVGEGTGLGLSVSHGVVTEHGGQIVCNSELGKGTSFQVSLPALAG